MSLCVRTWISERRRRPKKDRLRMMRSRRASSALIEVGLDNCISNK
jgi:hypothetical protein